MRSRSLGARSYSKYAYKVPPTFAPLTRNMGSQAQIKKHSMVFSTVVLGGAMIARQPQVLQMAAVDTG